MPSIINATTTNGVAVSGDNSGALALQTNNGTTAVTINTSQGVQFLNSISVGNATPTTSGAGITFPATQSASSDANTLDDYEEGTWTPGLSAQNGSGGTLTSPAGRYTKIGRLVFIDCNFEINSLGTLSGVWYITGLPFTASSTFGQSQGAVRNQGVNDATYGNVFVVEAVAGQTVLRFHWPTNTSTQQLVQISSVSTNDFIALGLTYTV